MQSLLNICIEVVIDKMLAQVTDDTTLGAQILIAYEERRRQLAANFIAKINRYDEYDVGNGLKIRVSELQAARAYLKRVS
jgi:hypothetical protein